MFHPERDANPFLHLYESLWMLGGRNDLEPLLKFTQQFKEYSDDGETLRGAYGYRWAQCEQLDIIARRLKKDPMDRRCVLQMWDVLRDLDYDGKDVPCNLVATFQMVQDRYLNMVVFNRSNDIIWGCYGANAVHFSMLQEYMANKIGCQMGTYTQVSVNWHVYEQVFERMEMICEMKTPVHDPYAFNGIETLAMPGENCIDDVINALLHYVDEDFVREYGASNHSWFSMVYDVLYAHHLFKTLAAPEKYSASLELLGRRFQNIDWVVAAKQWIERRYSKWQAKMNRDT
jgi:hypothetical protein